MGVLTGRRGVAKLKGRKWFRPMEMRCLFPKWPVQSQRGAVHYQAKHPLFPQDVPGTPLFLSPTGLSWVRKLSGPCAPYLIENRLRCSCPKPRRAKPGDLRPESQRHLPAFRLGSHRGVLCSVGFKGECLACPMALSER